MALRPVLPGAVEAARPAARGSSLARLPATVPGPVEGRNPGPRGPAAVRGVPRPAGDRQDHIRIDRRPLDYSLGRGDAGLEAGLHLAIGSVERLAAGDARGPVVGTRRGRTRDAQGPALAAPGRPRVVPEHARYR